MNVRSYLFPVTAILLSALMIAGLVPPYNFSHFAWFCLIPLLLVLWSLKGKRLALKGFIIAWLVGFISFGIQVSWLGTVSWLGPILLAGYLALYFGIFGVFAATLGNPWKRSIAKRHLPIYCLLTAFTHATIWAGLEWLRGWLFTGFSWNGLGVAFHETLVLSQFADVLGVTGLSLILVFFQCVLIQVAVRLKQCAEDGMRRPRWDFMATVCLVACLLIYGLFRISGENTNTTVSLKALLVQLNVPHDGAEVLWSAEEVHMAYEEETISALETLAEEDEKKLQDAVKNRSDGTVDLSMPDWILWPETALHGRMIFGENGKSGQWQENIESISRVRKGHQADLIYGLVEMEGEAREDGLYPKKNGKIYNSIVVDTAEHGLQTYRKNHLVLFGETIPFVNSIPFLKWIYEQQAGVEYQGSFDAGDSLEPLAIELKQQKIEIIPSVCFEDTVARLTRKFVRDTPQIIVNLTNDAWFKTSPAAEQHFANARFRAIELRRPLLRCANSGVSAAVDTIGSTLHPSARKDQRIQCENGSPFVRDSLLVDLAIPLKSTFSLYAYIGDLGIILLAILGLLIAYAFRNRQVGSQHSDPPPKG